MNAPHGLSKHRLAELLRFAQDRAADGSQPYADLQVFRDLEALARSCVNTASGIAPTAVVEARVVPPTVEFDEVLIAIRRGEGYEDVPPELVAADAFGTSLFEWRVVEPLSPAASDH